eukprot:6189444-Pleurochrysis_carterae.AAC.2
MRADVCVGNGHSDASLCLRCSAAHFSVQAHVRLGAHVRNRIENKAEQHEAKDTGTSPQSRML